MPGQEKKKFAVRKKTSKFTPTPLGLWLRRVRITNELDQEEMASYLPYSRGMIGAMERGERNMGIEHVTEVLKAFPGAPPPPTGSDIQVIGVPIAEDRIAKIRYVGVVPCSSDWGDPLEAQDMRAIDSKFAGLNRFMARVIGDSCYPALQQGDLTIWEHDISPPYGCIVLAERQEERTCTVKQLMQGGAPNEPLLVPINPAMKAPSNDKPWQVSARLVGVIRDEDGEMTWYKPAGLRPDNLIPRYQPSIVEPRRTGR